MRMKQLNRRSFLGLGVRLGALMGVGAGALPRITEALAEVARGAAPVIWLQGQCCTGCSVSLLNAESVTPSRLLTHYINLGFHQTLSATAGHQALETVNRALTQPDRVVIVEGTVPLGMPQACRVGEETFASQLSRAVQGAKAVVAVGACAAHGGIPAAANNPTGAASVPKFLAQQGVRVPTVLIPGCPAHPDWLLGTVVHLLKFGLPTLDAEGRPKMFFDRVVHDQCPRFADYERERFAATFADEGCFFKLGCLGPRTKADCNLRQWNGGTNTCIRAGAPCIGCASPDFALRTDFSFFTKNRAARPATGNKHA